MSPLWGLRHNAREEGREDETERRHSGETGHHDNRRRGQEVDERTRLLPAEGNGYLHPDDPAVCL